MSNSKEYQKLKRNFERRTDTVVKYWQSKYAKILTRELAGFELINFCNKLIKFVGRNIAEGEKVQKMVEEVLARPELYSVEDINNFKLQLALFRSTIALQKLMQAKLVQAKEVESKEIEERLNGGNSNG